MSNAILPEVEAKIGKVIGSRAVERTFGGYRSRVGYRVIVRLADGSEITRTASEHEKLVCRNWPKGVHRLQPQVRVGDVVRVENADRCLWFGKVVKITQTEFTVALHRVENYGGGELVTKYVGDKTTVEAELADYAIGQKENR